jgi:YVTN family beta-propeller protein
VTNTVVGLPIPVGSNPWGVAVAPDGSKVYVAQGCEGGTFVAVIDTTTNAVTARSRCRQSTPLAYGSKVYVTGAHGGGSVIDRTTNTEIAGFGGPFTLGIVVTPDGSKVYYTDDFGGSMRRPTHWST